MKTIVLLQLKYPHGGSQAYLPGSLLNLGSRLMAIGWKASLFDLNFVELNADALQAAIAGSAAIGISITGTPYIPGALRTIQTLRQLGYTGRILLGGEGIMRFTREQFQKLCAQLGDVRQVTTDQELIDTLGLYLQKLPNMFEASMVPMLQTLSRTQLRQYLTREFCVFLSYGCVYNCNFCSAAKGMSETYRHLEQLREELEFLCTFLASIKHAVLEIYLSNLDIMQTIRAFEPALQLINEIATKHGIKVKARGLATTHFLCRATRHDPAVLRRLRSYGLNAIGFGVDGADARVWQRENKKHNHLNEIDQALRLTKEAGITPEALMVIGFPQDDAKSLFATLKYSLICRARGAVLRTYLGKYGTPGSKLWAEDAALVEHYLAHPDSFRLLDYAMFGSPVTHPKRSQRWLANASFALLILLGLGGEHATYPLFPNSRVLNRLMPFDH